ncbi:sigma-70 family RNA polymerase sigma factor [Candidatus Falkowbacteria bacterium]|jgi:RNA polymerase primary sigma factor|nr:sigma-70 family RNA polymerase sigma factor [Candidatus Falkowbacteria bacterium]MBT5503590.1 sigma-70 family RNA polymerase sigma factor [Candidatus Falkowbacteria bacterium]MBT6573990.1 sigma-70 family RNA polymerase sigma factor [Candidatus Falkowbacteria bacterium]MBT7348435.1 sigma-70 family RNA polymerase sigma factor [Candidatus Falkowbacteria bacterium]MBT7500611.1 sigma-70 family RNA polymerase sigma factor [Candidatus Falkowbacteria bacterium]
MKPRSAFRNRGRSKGSPRSNSTFSEINRYLAPFSQHMNNFKSVDNIGLIKNYHLVKSPRAKTKIRDLLVYNNIKLVVKIALKYSNQGVPVDDLIQEGVLGLMKAIDKFDPGRGFLLPTYAVWWIRQAVSRAVQDQTNEDPYRVSNNFRDKISIVKVETYKLVRDSNGKWPTPEEVLVEIKKRDTQASENFTLEDVQKVQAHLTNRNIQLDVELESIESKETTSIESLFPDTIHSYADIDTMIQARRKFAESQEFLDTIEQYIYRLEIRMGVILKHRLGINGAEEMTLEELAQIFKVSRERIRQIEAKGYELLEKTLGLEKKELQYLILSHEEVGKIVGSDS